MVTIGNHEYEFDFTMPVWEKFENEVCLIDDFDQMMNQKGRLRKIALAAAILSVEQPVSAEKLFRDMTPADVRVVVAEIRAAIRKGLKMEVKQGEDRVVDEVLEELEKKETQAD